MLLLALAAPAAHADALAERLPRLHAPVATPQPHAGAIAVGESDLVSRTVAGVSVPLHLEAAGHSLGTARLIGGVDTSAADGTAVGGLAWQAGGPDGLAAGLGVLRTGLPAVAGGGLLTQASLRLPLPFLQNAPSLGLAFGSYAGDAQQDGGAAGRLSLAANVLGGRYSLSYAQAQAGFHPPGSQLTANQISLDLSARYALGRYQLEQRLRFRQVRPGQPGETNTWRSDTFWSGPVAGLIPFMTTFRLHLGLRFRRETDRHASHTGWLLEAQGGGISLRAWRFDTRLALGRTAACTPIGHVAWQMGGTRPIRLGNFVSSLTTHFGVKLRTSTRTRWRMRAGVRLEMQHSVRQMSFGVHWTTNNWHGNARDQSTWRVMFRYSIAATSALPRLALAIRQLMP